MLRKLWDVLGRYREPKTTIPIASLPPELVHVILLTYSEGRPLSSQDKRTLSRCSLTCRHWATVLRPLLFEHLVLRSKEDIGSLLALPASVIQLVSSVDLAMGPSLPRTPWLHYARKLKQINDSVAIRLLALQYPGSWSGTSSSTCSSVPEEGHIEMKYAISDTLPPLVPAWTLSITELSLHGLEIASVTVVSRLVAQLQTVRSCSCQDVSFAALNSTTIPRAVRRGTRRKLMQDLEVTSSRCTIASAAPEDDAVDHSGAVSASIFTSVQCPPDLADVWARTTSLLTRLCSTCVYDYAKVGAVSGGARAIEQYSTCDISLEASFVLNPQGDVSAVIDLLLAISSGTVEDIEEFLDWSALSDVFADENPFGDFIVHTSNVKWATDFNIPDDTLEHPLQKIITSGRMRVVCDKMYQSTPISTAVESRAGADGAASISYTIVTKLGNLRPRHRRESLEPSHELYPDPGDIRPQDALLLVPVLAAAGALVKYAGSADRMYSATSTRISSASRPRHKPHRLAVFEPSRSEVRESAKQDHISTTPAMTHFNRGRSDDGTQSLPVSGTSPSYHSFVEYDVAVSQDLPGIIVPQQVYKAPAGQSDFDKLASIRFVRYGKPGVHLLDALRLPIFPLDDAQSEPKLSEAGGRVALRILWPGYAPWARHNAIDIFEHIWKKKPVTLERVAQRVATLVREFCEEKSCEQSHDPSWELGTDSFQRIYLIELKHVSTGGWQPVISWDCM